MADAAPNYGLIAYLIVFAIMVIPFMLAFKQVPDHQRLIVERMGRYLRVCGPGKHYIMPFIDRAIVIDLETELPGWQGMTEREIVAKITRQRYGVEMT